VVIIWKAPAENLIKQAAYWNWLEIAFWTGVAVFAARLLFQMVSLYKIHARSVTKQINGQAVRVVKGDISPFSFWKSIYVNPEKLSSTDLKNVLAHEQVHVDEWHTLDILLTEISVVFYWFNPGIWMMKRAVRENIEFITDRKILQKGMDSKTYQYSLLNITFNQPAPAITSNFNFSTLKKRIMMMNAKRSSRMTLTRYAFLVPMVVVCLFTFSLSKAEVVKSSPAFKAVAGAVKNINSVVLNHDTVPATTRTVTGTLTIKKGVNGTTKVITLKGADVNNLTVKIDSPVVERQTVTVTGKRPGQKDSVITFTIAGKPMGTYKSSFDGAQTLNGNIKIDAGKLVNGLSFSNATDYSTSYDYKVKSTDGASVTVPEKEMATDVKGFSIDSANKRSTKSYKNSEVLNGIEPIYYSFKKSPSTTGTTNADKLKEVTVVGKPISSNGLYRMVTTDPNGKQVDPVQPLFVVDGKEVNQKELKSFEGNVQYLDPKAATSTYGLKGKNGALIMTTKKS